MAALLVLLLLLRLCSWRAQRSEGNERRKRWKPRNRLPLNEAKRREPRRLLLLLLKEYLL